MVSTGTAIVAGTAVVGGLLSQAKFLNRFTGEEDSGPGVNSKTRISPNNADSILLYNPRGKKSMLDHAVIVMDREVELLHAFTGLQERRQFKLTDGSDNKIGSIEESTDSITENISRQILKNARTMLFDIKDANGEVYLRLVRPFKWLTNAEMKVFDKKGTLIGSAREVNFEKMDSVGDLFNRRYMFASLGVDFAEAEASMMGNNYRITTLKTKRLLGTMNLQSTTIVRELFTDSSKFAINMDSVSKEPLSLDQRAIFLAFAVAQDADHFSSRSH